MITARAFDVELRVEGRTVRAPAGYALLYGSPIPSGTALWMAFDRTPVDVRPSSDAKKYVGPEVSVRRGVQLPDMDLKTWSPIGEVDDVLYYRRGTHQGDYVHPFGGKMLWVFSRRKPMLYRQGAIMRVELRGASWGVRGFEG